jgi:hypothetical protein
MSLVKLLPAWFHAIADYAVGLGLIVIALAVGGLAFGTIRGQQHGWGEPIAVASLAVGLAAAIAFPFLMLHRKDPLVPPKLFRSRNFTVTNISTFVIYGALYVGLTFQGIFLIGTLGYNEQAAGLAGVAGFLFLVFFSARFGRLAARYGPRFFMATGPAVMTLGFLWFARIPSSSHAWILGTGVGASMLPPHDYVVDLLPGYLLFGIGLMIMVAPLTTALMTSVPSSNSGVASAINNAISRVGSPIVNAVIFVAVASSFYATIAHSVPGTDSISSTASSMSAFKPRSTSTNGTTVVINDADEFHIVATNTLEETIGATPAPVDNSPSAPAMATSSPGSTMAITTNSGIRARKTANSPSPMSAQENTPSTPLPTGF